MAHFVQASKYQHIVKWLYWAQIQNMMTSSNGNISALLAICMGNLPVIGEFPAQRPVTRVFDVFFDLHLNDRFIKQLWGATVMKWTIHTLSTHKGSKYLAHQTNNPCCQLYAMLQNRSIYLKECVLFADMALCKCWNMLGAHQMLPDEL